MFFKLRYIAMIDHINVLNVSEYIVLFLSKSLHLLNI